MAATVIKSRKFGKLDDLFQLGQSEQIKEQPNPGQVFLTYDQLCPFRAHPFRLYSGERLEDMVESVRTHGVLVPIIVRKLDREYEILAGHNRVEAARLADLPQIPAIVLEGISDEEAWIYVVETNLMQRSFSEMAHSEKAAVIALHHSKLFSQGKRNDIVAALQQLESASIDTYAQVAQKSSSRDIVAKEYGLSKDTVARYLRIQKLIQPLKDRLDAGEIPFIPSVTLSFLTESEQQQLEKCLELNGFRVNMKKADILRDYSGQGKLSEDYIYLILNGDLAPRPAASLPSTIRIKRDVYTRYFKPEQTEEEIHSVIEQALELYFTNENQQ